MLNNPLLIQFLNRHKLYFLFQAIALLILKRFTIFHEAGLNDGDSITHYLISRYSWKYHYLFLDNWGKPFFILLSSPFAQFGMPGIQVFNVCCAVLSGWFCYRIAQKLNLKMAFLAPLALFMTPIYFTTIPSGLTEILFGLVLILSIFLVLDKKYILAAILISFLPFCRSEGFLLIPFIGLYLLWHKKFLAIPFLAFGVLIYSLIGYYYLHDLLWISHTNPYHGTNVYGHGSFFIFIESYMPIFGNLLGILFLVGTIDYGISFYNWLKIKNKLSIFISLNWMIIWVPVIGYVFAHSLFWYKGWFGSLGMWRVMAGIAPLYILTSLKGLDIILDLIKNKAITQTIISFLADILKAIISFLENLAKNYAWIILVGIIIYQPIRYYGMPVRLNPNKIAIRDACEWVKNNHYKNRKIFYSEPFTKICLDLDPYDNIVSEELMFVWHDKDFGNDMPKNSIIIWESGLGPREDRVKIESLMNDPIRFKLLKSYEPEHKPGEKPDYEVYVFEKTQ